MVEIARQVVDEEPEPETNRARGGHARAAALTADQRREIARKAAQTLWRKYMGDHWNKLLPFRVTVKEGSPDTGPPFLEIMDCATLDDGRTAYAYLIPKYEDDYQTMEGYMRCYGHAERMRDHLNETIASIGITAYRPGSRIP